MTEPDIPSEKPETPAEAASSFVPDSDDLRPFPEVSEDLVDSMMRELIKAAHAAASPRPAPPPPT